MKKRKEIQNKEKYVSTSDLEPDYEDRSDFYRRWYEKFGEPKTVTLPGDVFMKQLKEMIEFE